MIYVDDEIHILLLSTRVGFEAPPLPIHDTGKYEY